MSENVVEDYVSLMIFWSCGICHELLREHEGTWSVGLCENVCRRAGCKINTLTKQDCAGNTGNVCFWQWIQ